MFLGILSKSTCRPQYAPNRTIGHLPELVDLGAATYCNDATIQQPVFGLIAYQNDGKGCTVIADKIERA